MNKITLTIDNCVDCPYSSFDSSSFGGDSLRCYKTMINPPSNTRLGKEIVSFESPHYTDSQRPPLRIIDTHIPRLTDNQLERRKQSVIPDWCPLIEYPEVKTDAKD